MPKISERTLKQWRKEALSEIDKLSCFSGESMLEPWFTREETKIDCQKILSLTQILLDQYLLEKK